MNQKGFSLVEVLVVAGLLGVVTLGALTLFDSMTKERARQNTAMVLDGIRGRITSLIQDPIAWTATTYAAPNTGMACLRAGASVLCKHDAVVAPVLHNQVSTLIYNTTTQGFDIGGEICALGDAVCAFRYDIKTQMTCAAGLTECAKPSLKTTANLIVINPSQFKFPINTAHYSFEVAQVVRAIASAAGTSASYSYDCVDWAAAGWPDRDACLQDGRIHKLYQHNPVGSAVFGSLSELIDHATRGASVMVTGHIPGTNFGAEPCQVVRVDLGHLVCVTSYRLSGAFPSINFGSAEWKTSGHLWCATQERRDPAGNILPLTGPGFNACSTEPTKLMYYMTGMTWTIRY